MKTLRQKIAEALASANSHSDGLTDPDYAVQYYKDADAAMLTVADHFGIPVDSLDHAIVGFGTCKEFFSVHPVKL